MIVYKSNIVPQIDMVIDLYKDAGLKRPVGDEERIRNMYENANLIVTAWDDNILVGVSRALTDFSYCCYLSDLAVRSAYQKQGIGKKLIELTNELCSDQAMLLLLSAPSALSYYPAAGFKKVENGFIINRKI
ncbi:N-acetylglutamate synthase-like GNAT family acetyltransferase [Pedobacter sp. AK017]|uniref:GNAT family N-acetyltransferase n=1 Tax=Pedobacter sp. AK017 TaxID=2723073 RepID=UPI00161257EA|nr:GNAT family N-acetyltransferase [Pedobacter sp. AK017]MBB5441364.1 N-acetylglutamate synthase-like GNAT family acetyltransferase [Pedobacter sp. AK017]